MASYTRLSALDRSFLDLEDHTSHMHVGATCIYEVGPLRTADGGIDIDKIRDYIGSRLHLIPRFRQRLANIPIENHPIWVDDANFYLPYHVRHTSLPRPGGERQLKRLSGRIFSQELDRGKPLWEAWIVEGLEGDRFAIIHKTHHCMIDGLSGASLLSVMNSPSADTDTGTVHRWHPRPAPRDRVLIGDAILRRVTAPFQLAGRLLDKVRTDAMGMWSELYGMIGSIGEAITASVRVAADTPLNQEIGAHRRFDWLVMDLGDVKAVKNRLGGTVNDVVLTTVTGAVREFFIHQGAQPEPAEEAAFRCFCPVGLQAAGRASMRSNAVSAMVVELPIGEEAAHRRMELVRERTKQRKESGQAEGTEIIETIADWTMPTLLSWISRLAARNRLYNMIVTNVPGPQFPLYMLGSRMLEAYPLVPLFKNQGIGIALLSYRGKLYWGFNADHDVLPELHDFMLCVEQSFAELCETAGMRPKAARELQGQEAEASAVQERTTEKADTVAGRAQEGEVEDSAARGQMEMPAGDGDGAVQIGEPERPTRH